jgi:ammonium transporter, Amt family
VLGSRKDYGRTAVLPHNVPFVLLGAGLLWFGWFGFNGGSALAANELASLAFTNTFLAPAATLVVWTLLDYFRTGKATAVGGATGIVVGLVAITPAAGFVSPISALVLGAVAAFPSYFVIQLRSRTRIDDSLDVFAGHGIGGLTGALLTGILAQKVWNSAGNDGLLFGNPHQLAVQALACLSAAAYAGVMTFVILKVLGLVMSLRAVPRVEGVGMDVSQHGEEAYASGEGSILVPPEVVLVPDTLPAFTPQVASR